MICDSVFVNVDAAGRIVFQFGPFDSKSKRQSRLIVFLHSVVGVFVIAPRGSYPYTFNRVRYTLLLRLSTCSELHGVYYLTRVCAPAIRHGFELRVRLVGNTHAGAERTGEHGTAEQINFRRAQTDAHVISNPTRPRCRLDTHKHVPRRCE